MSQLWNAVIEGHEPLNVKNLTTSLCRSWLLASVPPPIYLRLVHDAIATNFLLLAQENQISRLENALIKKFYNIPVYMYCIDGVVIAAQCTATFLRSIVLPEFRHY